MHVYDIVSRKEMKKSGRGKLIKGRWLDVNNVDSVTPDVRSRYVGKEFATGVDASLCAGTPPLEAIKMFIGKVASKKDEKGKPLYQLRHVSPTETERLLGFPTDWTEPTPASTDECKAEKASTDEHTVANRRRNAVGNAFAVPVVRRILQALVVAHWSKGSKGMEMWADTQLAAPYHPDILDDILPHTQSIAAEFQDLTCEFD